MNKEQALHKISTLNILNNTIREVGSNREYKITHISESINLDNSNYDIQVSLSQTKPVILDTIRVEKYSTIQSGFVFINETNAHQQ